MAWNSSHSPQVNPLLSGVLPLQATQGLPLLPALLPPPAPAAAPAAAATARAAALLLLLAPPLAAAPLSRLVVVEHTPRLVRGARGFSVSPGHSCCSAVRPSLAASRHLQHNSGCQVHVERCLTNCRQPLHAAASLKRCRCCNQTCLPSVAMVRCVEHT